MLYTAMIMSKEQLISELETTRRFFNNTTSCFEETDSSFSPVAGVYTVCQHVAHTGLTVDWFFEGAFMRPDGFDLDFARAHSEIIEVLSLAEARKSLARAFDRGVEIIRGSTEQELAVPLPKGPIMQGLPRAAIVGAIADHTAHHRGALAVYARILGKTPPMPYG